MTEQNLKWQLQPDNSVINWDSVMIGSSHFSDDIWDISALILPKATINSMKRIDFRFIESAAMKNTIKQYAYHKLGKIKPLTVKNMVNSRLASFCSFCMSNGILKFSDLTREHILTYGLWLKEEKKLAKGSIYNCVHLVEDIVKVGQIKGWDVPQSNIFIGMSSYQLWGQKWATRTNKTKPIPPDVFDKILHYAVYYEQDILTKAGIIIQSQTGLRISEVLSIQEGCVKTTSDGYEYMEVLLSKTEKGEPVVHKVFINELVKDTIHELSQATASLRAESGLRELFLTRRRTIRVMNHSNWNNNRLKNFVKRWDIRDNKGDLYHITSHQFRATFVRELVKQKVPLAIIMKQYGHVSFEMTSHYLTLHADEVKDIYSDMILSPESKIAGLRAKEIKCKLNSLFNGKTTDEIEEVITELTKTMSFNPLPTGVCLYDFRRGNCTDGDGCFMYNCPNYITEVQFYPILKKELDLLELELTRLKELGFERQWQVEYVKYKYLKPLVEELEVQLHE